MKLSLSKISMVARLSGLVLFSAVIAALLSHTIVATAPYPVNNTAGIPLLSAWSTPQYLGHGDGMVDIVRFDEDGILVLRESGVESVYSYFDGSSWSPDSVITELNGPKKLLSNGRSDAGVIVAADDGLYYAAWNGNAFEAFQYVLPPLQNGAHIQMSTNGDVVIVGSFEPAEYCYTFIVRYQCDAVYCPESYDPHLLIWRPNVGIVESRFLARASWNEGEFYWIVDDPKCNVQKAKGIRFGPLHVLGEFDDGSRKTWFDIVDMFYALAGCKWYSPPMYTCDWIDKGPDIPPHTTAFHSDDISGHSADEYIRLIYTDTGIYTEAPDSDCDMVFEGAESAALTHFPFGGYILTLFRNSVIETYIADASRTEWQAFDDAAYLSTCHAMASCTDGSGYVWLVYREDNDVYVTTTAPDLPIPETPTPTATPATPIPTTTPIPPTATPTMTPTMTPVPATPTPTATPIPPDPGVDIFIDPTWFTPGDTVAVRAFCSGYPNTYQANLYVILDVYSQYWFWPDWSETPGYKTISLQPGKTTPIFVLDITWPDITDSAEGLIFWGGMLDVESNNLIGTVGFSEFGYGP